MKVKYQLRAKFVGETWSREPYELHYGDYIVRLSTGTDRIVNEITVGKPVQDYAQYIPDLSFDGSTPTVLFPENPYHDDLVSLLQYIESVGSYWCGIIRIGWDSVRVDWVPETEDERLLLKANNVQVQRSFDQTPDELHPAMMASFLKHRDSLGELTIPLSFFREGRNEYRSFRFLYAFLNFYLFLEGLFGDGKTKNYQIEHQFKNSPEMRNAVDRTLKGLDPDQRARVGNLCHAEHREFSIDGVMELLVRIRGNLFHFSLHSSKKKGHPLNQMEFALLALLTLGISLHVLAQVFPSWPNIGQTNASKY